MLSESVLFFTYKLSFTSNKCISTIIHLFTLSFCRYVLWCHSSLWFIYVTLMMITCIFLICPNCNPGTNYKVASQLATISGFTWSISHAPKESVRSTASGSVIFIFSFGLLPFPWECSSPLKSTQIHLARHCCCFLWLILVHGFPRVLLQTRESNYCIFTVAMFSVLFTS